MRVTSGTPFALDNTSSNFFDVGTPPPPTFSATTPLSNQAYFPQGSLMQVNNHMVTSEQLNPVYRQTNVPSQRQMQTNLGGASPIRARPPVLDNDPKASVASFDRSGVPRRPMSQVPTTTTRPTGAPGAPASDPLNQYQPRPPAVQGGVGPAQPPPQFTQAQSSSQFNQSGVQFGMSREALRENIQKKGTLVTELTQNKAFFREALDRKSADFKEIIRNDLKKTVFDRVLKTNLHYIYKHYENLKTTVNREDTLRILNTNLAKQQKEIKEGRAALAQTEASEKSLEERLLAVVNQPGVIRARPAIVENITKEDMDRKVAELRRENAEIEQALDALRRRRDKELYDLKMKHEIKGRVVMEQRAIGLALQHVDPQDPQQVALKQRIEDLVRTIEANDAARKANPNYALGEKKDKLEKELEVLKF